jgi:4-hydroxy-tetrahydrodipicolinate synthase
MNRPFRRWWRARSPREHTAWFRAARPAKAHPEPKEHVRVVEMCVEAAAGKVPVIAGAGSNNTAHAIELAQHVKRRWRRRGACSRAVLQQAKPRRHVRALQGDQRRRRYSDVHLQRAGSHGRRHLAGNGWALGAAEECRRHQGCVERSWPHRANTALAGENFIQLSGDDPNAIGFNAHGGAAAFR